MSEASTPVVERRNVDWQPWAILGVLILALLVIVWIANKPKPELGARTAKTGLPLTPEQRSVDFQTADLTFDVQPSHKRIDGRAMPR